MKGERLITYCDTKTTITYGPILEALQDFGRLNLHSEFVGLLQ